MRVASKIDVNQPQIVRALRDVGATVQVLSHVGKGCPDLMIGFRGRNFLLEVKDGDKPLSRQSLTRDEQHWHATWQGEVIIVNSVENALQAIGALA